MEVQRWRDLARSNSQAYWEGVRTGHAVGTTDDDNRARWLAYHELMAAGEDEAARMCLYELPR